MATTQRLTMPDIISPFARPLYVMLKPAGSLCNMRCDYCYYLEKSKLYPQKEERLMNDEMLELFIKQYIESQTQPQILFTWHGGEPLMRPLSFYRHAIKLQRNYAHGRQIENCIQTNGTLLTDEWCEFFKANNILVGISIDGPKEFHDSYRHTQQGGPTFDKVMAGIRLLQKHGVEWNAMAVVNNRNADHPQAFYQFFKSLGCQFLQFTPIVERTVERPDGLTLAPGMTTGGVLTDFSITPRQWGNFLCGVYDQWVKNDVGKVFVQLFDASLANWMGVNPGLCTMSSQCGHAAVMEANGDLYSCDHFVYPEHLLGNIRQLTITGMMYGQQQQEFAKMKTASLPRQCRECRFLFACHGECPKNRFIEDRHGEPGLNYLCTGYRQFFEHVANDMEFMCNELRHQRPPANIMEMKKK